MRVREWRSDLRRECAVESLVCRWAMLEAWERRDEWRDRTDELISLSISASREPKSANRVEEF